MTETISLIAVVVMAWLLWRERRAHVATVAEHESLYRRANDRIDELEYVAAKYARLTDRDEKGRFVKRERGEAL